ncbi:MAG: hypothetical protein O3A52_05525, partial [Bacteroidetes bacterium]|nr:hypothetical protein [Bacteroidota bacterium]
MAVRDDAIVMGNKLLITNPHPYLVAQAMPHYKEMFGNQIDNSIHSDDVRFKRSVRNIKSWAKRNNLS